MASSHKWLLSGALLLGMILLMGANPSVSPLEDSNISSTFRVEEKARFWVEDLGKVNSSSLTYSDEYEAIVWRVEGENTTVVMDDNYDLLGFELH